MSASESTKLQINFKTSDGTLINLYAKDEPELAAGLVTLTALAAEIAQTAQALQGVVELTAVSKPATDITTARSYTPPTQVQNPGNDAPICQHGAMVYRTGNSTKGPWKGWFCPTPKGTTGQCEPQFIRG